MHNRSAFMKSVWSHYRCVAVPLRPFDRRLFADVLRFMWKGERTRIRADREGAARRAEPVAIIISAPARPMSEMERRIDDLKFLSARYRMDLMAAEIRAEYAHA